MAFVFGIFVNLSSEIIRKVRRVSSEFICWLPVDGACYFNLLFCASKNYGEDIFSFTSLFKLYIQNRSLYVVWIKSHKYLFALPNLKH